jgi:hypothetical protein
LESRSESRRARSGVGRDHVFAGDHAEESGISEKKNPAVGTPGQTFVVIGVYGFKYAAWLPFLTSEDAESVLFFFFSQCFFLVLLLSCSSLTFLNLTEPFANSHRFLSVCALTRPWVGTRQEKQDPCHEQIDQQNHRDSFHTCFATRKFPARL